ncbi:MAG: hypothetical protein AAGA60_30235 [Cyanobacteria bacterium P01_E01_bin.42]
MTTTHLEEDVKEVLDEFLCCQEQIEGSFGEELKAIATNLEIATDRAREGNGSVFLRLLMAEIPSEDLKEPYFLGVTADLSLEKCFATFSYRDVRFKVFFAPRVGEQWRIEIAGDRDRVADRGSLWGVLDCVCAQIQLNEQIHEG